MYAFMEHKNEMEDMEEERIIYLDLFIIALIQQIERHKKYLLNPTENKAEQITEHYENIKRAENDLDELSKDALQRFKAMIRYEECINIRVNLQERETNGNETNKPKEEVYSESHDDK
jgi:hypothetical protein